MNKNKQTKVIVIVASALVLACCLLICLVVAGFLLLRPNQIQITNPLEQLFSTPTPIPTPTPPPTLVNGTLTVWDEGNGVVSNRQLLLCQIPGDIQTLPADCVLQNRVILSDAQGTFQITDIRPGYYFILYDSGLSDFMTGLGTWQNQTLYLSDINWITATYCGSPDGDVSVHFLGGMSINEETFTSLTQALFVCDSPFVLALDPNSSDLAPLVLRVTEGETTNTAFRVGFGK